MLLFSIHQPRKWKLMAIIGANAPMVLHSLLCNNFSVNFLLRPIYCGDQHRAYFGESSLPMHGINAMHRAFLWHTQGSCREYEMYRKFMILLHTFFHRNVFLRIERTHFHRSWILAYFCWPTKIHAHLISFVCKTTSSKKANEMKGKNTASI